jgi:hypothetical protein
MTYKGKLNNFAVELHVYIDDIALDLHLMLKCSTVV